MAFQKAIRAVSNTAATQRSGTPSERLAQSALAIIGRDAKASWFGASVDLRAGFATLRRTDNRLGPHHERRYQRAHSPHSKALFVTSIVVTHDMHSARKIADRIIMLYPYSRLNPGESQILFDGPPDEIDKTKDRRVKQFCSWRGG